jgi:hypothetical protein
MHYLVEQEITPAEVVKLSRQKGENLDTWSRRAAKRRSLSPSVNSPHALSGALFQATITVQFNRHDEASSWRIWDEDLIKKLIRQLSEWSEDRPEAVSQGSTIKRGPPNAL